MPHSRAPAPFLGIKDLRFHDLRHEATSRLFERGYQIHEVAQFTLHDSWNELKRYANLRPELLRDLAPTPIVLPNIESSALSTTPNSQSVTMLPVHVGDRSARQGRRH